MDTKLSATYTRVRENVREKLIGGTFVGALGLFLSFHGFIAVKPSRLHCRPLISS